MDYRDYYQILGVPRSATAAEIKKAFRKLAREHHPDRNPGDAAAEKRFKDINEANTVLSDPERRRQYDALGANWEQYARAGGAAGGGPGAGAAGDPFGPGGPFAGFGGFGSSGSGAGGGNVRYEFRTSGAGDAGFSDFFRAFFSGRGGAPGAGAAAAAQQGARAAGRGRGASTGTSGSAGAAGASFENILSQMGWDGSGQPAGNGSRRGRATSSDGAGSREVEAPAELTLEESYHGTSRIVEVEGKRYEVAIPRGVDSGSRVRLSGTGPGGRDVVVTIRMRPHDVFTRRGPDLERDLPLTLREALLGAEVPVGTLKGRVLLTIPAGTQSGRTFRLAGQGMPRMKEEGVGDLFVRTRVILPTTLNEEAKAAAVRFLDLVPQPDPRATT